MSTYSETPQFETFQPIQSEATSLHTELQAEPAPREMNGLETTIVLGGLTIAALVMWAKAENLQFPRIRRKKDESLSQTDQE